jgi:predicted RNA-binding Zn ribbon-like protein
MPYAEPEQVRLMNTIWADTDGLHDDLTTTADLRDWLTATGNPVRGTPTRRDLDRARLLRDALRRLAASVTDDVRPAAQSPVVDHDEAITVINELAAGAPRDQLVMRNGRLTLTHDTAADSAAAALSTVATAAIHLFAGPNAETLHACLAPGCVRYFTKSHRHREWCSEACGNRVRAARHYRRVRTGS